MDLSPTQPQKEEEDVTLPEAAQPEESAPDPIKEDGAGGLTGWTRPPEASDAYESASRVMEALQKRQPLNIFGPMGAGKSTLAKFTGYEAIEDEQIWRDLVNTFAPEAAPHEQGALNDALGSTLPVALKSLVLARLAQIPDSYDGKALNVWIPYMEEPFLNIYLLVKREEVIQERRQSSVSADDHFSQIKSQVDEFITRPNVVVFYTEDEINALAEEEE